jgi:SAM-dependent methyltransferase
MTTPLVATPESQFDAYAQKYEAALRQGLRFAGEAPHYFAERRIEWVAQLLANTGHVSDRVLDFGCGVGLAAAPLQRHLQPRTLWGYDPSRQAIDRARRSVAMRARTATRPPTGASTGATSGATSDATSDDSTVTCPCHFTHRADELPTAAIDLAYCNGVFHHIPLAQRAQALATVWRALVPGGWFAFWENNPWNPGTRLVMRCVPFDRDAQVISPPAGRRLLREAGFDVLRTDAWFLFPQCLRWLRPLESVVHRLPLGAQYLILAKKAGSPPSPTTAPMP